MQILSIERVDTPLAPLFAGDAPKGNGPPRALASESGASAVI